MRQVKYYLIFLLLTTTACGVSTGDGFVMGSTSFLAEANRGYLSKRKQQPLEEHTQQDRQELASLVTRGAR